LERGGDVNAQGLLDETLLYSAVGGGKWKVVDALLKAGADVTVPNYVGETPLHRAADLGLADFVEALLEHGADPNAGPLSEIRPLHAAAWSNRTGKAGEEPKGVPKPQKRRVIQLLLKAGADPNAREGAGRTALDLYDESANKEGFAELKAAMKR
jgi:ankyrin repeat protein